jgi:hypothetical protein
MTAIHLLWLPILLSSILIFLVSSFVHMVMPWHKNDYPKMPDEDKVQEALRPLAIPPGDYMIPRPVNREDMKSPEFLGKINKGPILVMTVMPNTSMKMGKSLLQWFIYCFVIGLFAAYITGRALPTGSDYLQVFRFAGTTAFLGYSLALCQMSIWYKRSWNLTFKAIIDGLLYALLTAGIFGWLWPG